MVLLVMVLSLGKAVAPACAEAIAAPPRSAAPLGLRFGMMPQEVTLPVVVAPLTPWAAAPAIMPAHPATTIAPRAAAVPGAVLAPGPVVLFAPDKAPVPMRRPERAVRRADVAAPLLAAQPQPQGWAETYIRACEAAFDSMSNLGNRAERWRAWRARHIGAGEGADFGEFVAERARSASDRDSTEFARQLGARRAGGLYRFDPADARRVACLLFTSDGLAQVFIAGPALGGLRDEVIARLDRRNDRSERVTFALTREAGRFSLTASRPACGLYCRVFGDRLLVQRFFWLDQTSRVLIAAKRFATVSGLASLLADDATGRELVDGLPDSFIVYSDLSRRARILQTLVEPITAAKVNALAPPPTAPVPGSALTGAKPTDRRELLIDELAP